MTAGSACRIMAAMFAMAITVHASDVICFEAETAEAIEAPMQVGCGNDKSVAGALWKPVAGASADRYLEIPEGVGNPPKVTTGKAAWTITIPSKGTYYLWCRVWWGDECSNSFTISLDEARSFGFGQDGTYKNWHWVRAPRRLKQLELDAGPHTLTIKNREDGVRIDQVLLTNDQRFVPVEKEPVTVQASATQK